MKPTFGRGGILLSLALAACALAAAPGCGGDLKCGPGTHIEGGECVHDGADGGTTADAGGGKDGAVPGQDAGVQEAGAGPRCGDGKKDPGEECDDGNLNNNDACLKSCKKNICGDGILNAQAEECDDGDTDNTDHCINTCKVARCGDGYVFKGVEDCDDGNTMSGDTCPANCRSQVTGSPGKVTGKVRRFGLSSNPSISVTLSGGGGTTQTKTDGSFSMPSVKAGIYDLTASYAGYQKATFKNITVIPNATFAVPDLTLFRAETVDTGATWSGVSHGDTHLAWIDISGVLRMRAATGGPTQVVALGVSAAMHVNARKHLLYRTSSGDLYITSASLNLPVKITGKTHSYWTVKKDGWLLVRTIDKRLLFVSPDGASNTTVTTSYLSYRNLDKAGRVLVLGKDGVRSLPQAGGKVLSLDVNASDTYCGASLSSTGACTTSSLGVSQAEDLVYYYVHKGKTGEVRSSPTATAKPVKLIAMNWESHVSSASLSAYGSTSPHVRVQENGTKNNSTWRRFRTAPMKGGTESLVGEFNTVSGGTWYTRLTYASEGGAVAVVSYPYSNSSARTLRVAPGGGSGPVTVAGGNYFRHVYFSRDGKRVVYQLRNPAGQYSLHSASSSGSDKRTHHSHFGYSGSYSNYLGVLDKEVLFINRGGSSSYDFRRASYSSSSSSYLMTCDTYSSFSTYSPGSTLFNCYNGSTYTRYLYTTATGKAVKVCDSSSTSHYVSPDKKALVLRCYEKSAYSWSLLDLVKGTVTKMSTTQSSSYSVSWRTLASGAYAFYLSPSTTYSTDQPLYCGGSSPATAKLMGKTRTSPALISTTAKAQYLVFTDISTGTATLKYGPMSTCVASSPDATASTYSNFTLTPDDKALLYRADSGLRVAPLAGGKHIKLTSQGTLITMVGNQLLYRGYATSAKGAISAALTIPLTGGTPVPIDHSMSSVAKGTTDVMYRYSGLKYLKLP